MSKIIAASIITTDRTYQCELIDTALLEDAGHDDLAKDLEEAENDWIDLVDSGYNKDDLTDGYIETPCKTQVNATAIIWMT